MKYILGTKVGMVRLFETNGKSIPGTIVHCEPNTILEVKNAEKHKTIGVKVGYRSTKECKKNKPHNGIFKKVNLPVQHYIRTFTDISGDYQVGQQINVSSFQQGEFVDVQGFSKGHGFTGAIKRWNFKIGPLSHGAGYPHRFQGSIAMGRGGSQAQRVAKGKKMHGRYGHETTTAQNLNVLLVIPKENILVISGSVPGPKGSLLTIKSSDKIRDKTLKYDLLSKSNISAVLKANEKLEDKESMHEINAKIDEQVANDQQPNSTNETPKSDSIPASNSNDQSKGGE